MPKTATLGDSTHSLVTKFSGYLTGKSGERHSLSDTIDALLIGEPFVEPLKTILQHVTDTVEAFKKGETNESALISAVDELIRTNEWIVKELEVRSTDSEPNLELHTLRDSIKHWMESRK